MFLQSSVSGLRQLFSTAPSPHTLRSQRQLESVTEEAHTYDLLYPEGETLRQGQHYAYPLRLGDPSSAAAAASSSDDRGGLDIQSPRDVRIIIAQNASALSSQPRVLYDSHPPPPIPQTRNATFPEAAKHGHRKSGSFTGGRNGDNVKQPHTAPHTRQSSFSQTTHSIFTSPTSPFLQSVNSVACSATPEDATVLYGLRLVMERLRRAGSRENVEKRRMLCWTACLALQAFHQSPARSFMWDHLNHWTPRAIKA